VPPFSSISTIPFSLKKGGKIGFLYGEYRERISDKNNKMQSSRRLQAVKQIAVSIIKPIS